MLMPVTGCGNGIAIQKGVRVFFAYDRLIAVTLEQCPVDKPQQRQAEKVVEPPRGRHTTHRRAAAARFDGIEIDRLLIAQWSFPVTCSASLQYRSSAGQCRMRLLSDRPEAFPCSMNDTRIAVRRSPVPSEQVHRRFLLPRFRVMRVSYEDPGLEPAVKLPSASDIRLRPVTRSA